MLKSSELENTWETRSPFALFTLFRSSLPQISNLNLR